MNYFASALSLVTPLAMLIVGLYWKIKPPKRGGSGLAYRTALSDRTEETWAFAHRRISKLWIYDGLLLSVVSVILIVALKARFTDFFLWLIAGQMVLLCISAFLVEGLLKSFFDKDGNPISSDIP